MYYDIIIKKVNIKVNAETLVIYEKVYTPLKY